MLAILAAEALVWGAGLSGGLVASAVLAGLTAWLLWQDRFMRTTGGIPILTWHSVSRDVGWLPWAEATSVTPETLDRQLSLLHRMGCQSMDSLEFVRRRMAGADVPPETVILHFDDGYLDNWLAAAPLLARHGMRASLFVSLDFIAPPRLLPVTILDPGAVLRWDGYLSWDELRALDGGAFDGAFEIEAHGVDHGRVPVGPGVVARLTPASWRRLTKTGLIGLGLFLGVMLACLRKAVQVARHGVGPVAPLAYAFAGFLLASVFMPNEDTKFMWILPGLCLAAWRLTPAEMEGG